jgi:uncharacterized membrane protein YtjA (UPF0391 family)
MGINILGDCDYLWFGGIAGTAAGIAQILFCIFLAIFIISLLFGLARRRP